MAGPNEVPVPSEHPNNDLLADLAADVLSADLAGHVQEHVIGCSICAQVLADAETVRTMLLQIEPEQMPDAVLARLERALVAARREDESGARGGFAEDAAETRMLGRLPLVAESGQSDSGRRIARSVGPAPATGAITSSGPKTSRLNRMSAPTQSARRQAIEEQKAEEPSRLSRLLPALKIAAGVLVVVGVGAVAFQFRGDDSSGSADTTAASAGSAAPLVAPVQSTRTDYAKKALPTQVKTLIANSQKLLAAPQPEAAENSFGAERSLNDAAKSSGADAPRAPSPGASPGVQGQLLRSPKALQACLAAIGAAGVQPVAVDLAKYAGREAAIIVLPADGGGYDVWVVSRDCRPDNDGTIDVVNVKP